MSDLKHLEKERENLEKYIQAAMQEDDKKAAQARCAKKIDDFRELAIETLANDAKKRSGKCDLHGVSFCRKMLTPTDESISQAKEALPIVLIPMVASAIGIGFFVFYFVRWQFFGITDGITDYYLDNFDSAWDSYLWIASEMGVGEMIMFFIMVLLYIYVWRGIYIAFFY